MESSNRHITYEIGEKLETDNGQKKNEYKTKKRWRQEEESTK